jgi:hypothetical protein
MVMRVLGPQISLICLALMVAWSVPLFSGDVTLSWDPNSESDLAGYRIYYGTSSRTYDASIDAGMATTLTVTGLGLETYYFSATAYNSSGAESPFSNEVVKIFQPLPGTPNPDLPAITISHSPVITDSTATISWTTNKESGGRIVFGETVDYGASLSQSGETGTSHTIRLTGLKPNAVYHYQVQSGDAEGNLTITSDLTFTTAPSLESIVAQLALTYPHGIDSGIQTAETKDSGIVLTNSGQSPAYIRFTALSGSGAVVSGTGINNPAAIVLGPGQQISALDSHIFGEGIDAGARITAESSSPEVSGVFLIFDSMLNVMDGAAMAAAGLTDFILPKLEEDGFTRVSLLNPNGFPVDVTFYLLGPGGNGNLKGQATRLIEANGSLSADLFSDLFGGMSVDSGDYVRAHSSLRIIPYEFTGREARYLGALSGLDAGSGATLLYAPQYVAGGYWRSEVSIVNLDSFPGVVTLRLIDQNGLQIGETVSKAIAARGKIHFEDPGFFNNNPGELTIGYLEIAGNGVRLAGSIALGDAERKEVAALLPLISLTEGSALIGQIASSDTYYTGIAILNPGNTASLVTLDFYSSDGTKEDSVQLSLPAGQRLSRLLPEYLPALAGKGRMSGYIRISADAPFASYAFFGTHNLLWGQAP